MERKPTWVWAKRTSLGVVLALLLSLSAHGASATPKPTPKECAASGQRLIEQNGTVWVFRYSANRKATVYGCLRGHRVREIHAGQCDITTVCTFFPSHLIAGRYVFYAQQIDHRGESLFTQIHRVDLLTGHQAEFLPGGAGVQMVPTSEDKSRLTDLVARPDGSAAWIYENGQVTPPIFEVHIESRGGNPSLLAAASSITPGSLALAAGALYWTDSGTPRSALLP